MLSHALSFITQEVVAVGCLLREVGFKSEVPRTHVDQIAPLCTDIEGARYKDSAVHSLNLRIRYVYNGTSKCSIAW